MAATQVLAYTTLPVHKQKDMNDFFAVLLDDVAQLEYDRKVPLTEYQLAYLDSMNEKMAAGIDLAGESITDPDLSQKTQFVSANLLQAMQSGNEGMTSALCTWLAHHHPDLKQLRYTDDEGDISIELVYDEEYSKQVSVSFSDLN